MAHGVVDQAISVDVPLVCAFRAIDIDRKRLDEPPVMRDATGQRLSGALMHPLRAGKPVFVFPNQTGLDCCLRHVPNSLGELVRISRHSIEAVSCRWTGSAAA